MPVAPKITRFVITETGSREAILRCTVIGPGGSAMDAEPFFVTMAEAETYRLSRVDTAGVGWVVRPVTLGWSKP